MSEERVKKVDLPASEEGLEIQFGEHTVGWYRHAAWFAAQMHESRTLPGHIQSPQQAFAILCKGDELGLKPWASWTFIYPTKQGRLALMTKGALAVVQAKPSYEDYDERIENEGKPEMRAVAIATRKGKKPVIKEFSLQDAETAGLLKQRVNREGQKYDSTYQSFLKDMLLSRARGRALDIAFAAELGGIPIEGVAEDADMMAEREQGAPKQAAAAPPRRDPLLAAVGQKQLGPGGVSIVADERVPRGTVLMVDRQGREVGRVENLAEPELDPSLVKVIDQQVEEVFGPPDKPAPPAVKEPAPATPPAAPPGPTRPAVAGPSLGVAKKLGLPSVCQRCNHKLNAMGGCDFCGWPGEDLR